MAQESVGISENAIELITPNRTAHYEPFGWHHWPEHPWLSYQSAAASAKLRKAAAASAR
jgi:hypothetical protein